MASRRTVRLLTALLLIPVISQATAIAIVISRHRIVVAADGLVGGYGHPPSAGCKIGQVQSHSFYTLVGFKDTNMPISFSPWNTARDSFEVGVDPISAAAEFTKRASGPFLAVARYSIDHPMADCPKCARTPGTLLDVFFVGVKDQELLVVEVALSIDSKKSLIERTDIFKASEFADGKLTVVVDGYGEEMNSFMEAHPEWNGNGNVDGAKKLIQAAVDNIGVGPPIAILNLPDYPGTIAHWEDPGACPKIQP